MSCCNDDDDWDIVYQDLDEETSRRPGWLAWLILLLLVCSLLLPLISPLIRSYQYEYLPPPTPTRFPQNLVYHDRDVHMSYQRDYTSPGDTYRDYNL